MKIRKAVIPAAGLGTRFLPATKAQPKEMLPIVDRLAIQYIVEEAVKSGIEMGLQREALQLQLIEYLQQVLKKQLGKNWLKRVAAVRKGRPIRGYKEAYL